jgi:formylglycine-generating enzyme required for sulfatase activity
MEEAHYCVYCGHALRKKLKLTWPHVGIKNLEPWKIALVAALPILGVGTLVFSLARHGRDGESVDDGPRPAVAEVADLPVPVVAEVPTGVILLDSTPRGARIRVDGRKTGRTPCRLDDLPEGEHTVRVEYRRRGEEHCFEETVHVKDGKPVERTYRFFPDRKTVSIEAGSSTAGWSWSETENRIVFTRNGCSFSVVKIPAGQFYMDTEEDGFRNVSLGSYALGETEVTRGLWAEVMGSGTIDGGEAYPMNNLSYRDCEAFISALNRQTGERFRLPTEAEWEYAARGGRGAPDFWYAEPGNNLPPGFGDTGEYGPGQVYGRAPNTLGIFGMSGNVAEWCGDWYGDLEGGSADDPRGPSRGDRRVIRGSDYRHVTGLATYRYSASPNQRTDRVGFRIAI